MLPIKFHVQRPFISGEEAKHRFQDGGHGGHLGFSIETILAIFDLQVTPMLPTKFQVSWPFSSGGKRKIAFQDGGHGGHLGFPIGMFSIIFNLQVTWCILPSFKSIIEWLFYSREETKYIFKNNPWRSSWISDRNDCSWFWFTSHLDASYQVSSHLAFRIRRRSEK